MKSMNPTVSVENSIAASSSRKFLNSLDYFRGIAIIIIVAGHSFAAIGWEPSGFVEDILFNLVLGGTSLFVFISGFLFHHVFYEKFKYKKFLVNKVKYVLVPYLVMSSLPIVLALIQKSGEQIELNDYFFSGNQGVWAEYLRPMFLLIGTGHAAIAYWYIPFAMILFALSPLFIGYINSSLRVRNFCLLSSFVVAIIIHRPLYNLFVLQSIIYFLPVYLLGIQSSIHRTYIYTKLRNKEIYLLLLAIVLAVLQLKLLGSAGNFHKDMMVITIPDIIVLQKSLICLFFMVFLHRFESVNLSLLHRIASASFAIFFLHPLILRAFKFVLKYVALPIDNFGGWILMTALVVFLCYFIASALKKILPKSSRMIVGS